eukprot:4430914-Lingulodinium_polyedra.AAC.1
MRPPPPLPGQKPAPSTKEWDAGLAPAGRAAAAPAPVTPPRGAQGSKGGRQQPSRPTSTSSA